MRGPDAARPGTRRGPRLAPRRGRRRLRLLAAGVALLGAACSKPHVAPIPPGPYTERLEVPYGQVWQALLRVLAQENVQIRAIARDSGVIASEPVPTTIGLYADCGRFGEQRVEGEVQVAFTIYVRELSPTGTAVQINTRMVTEAYSRGPGRIKPRPAIPCASTGRWEANLLDTLRALLRP